MVYLKSIPTATANPTRLSQTIQLPKVAKKLTEQLRMAARAVVVVLEAERRAAVLAEAVLLGDHQVRVAPVPCQNTLPPAVRAYRPDGRQRLLSMAIWW